MVASWGGDVVEGHAGAAPGDLAFGGVDAGGVHLVGAGVFGYLGLSGKGVGLGGLRTLGQFSRSRGSTGRHRGRAAKKPTETAMRLLVRRIFSRSLRSRPLFLATNSMLSGR